MTLETLKDHIYQLSIQDRLTLVNLIISSLQESSLGSLSETFGQLEGPDWDGVREAIHEQRELDQQSIAE